MTSDNNFAAPIARLRELLTEYRDELPEWLVDEFARLVPALDQQSADIAALRALLGEGE